MSPPLEPPVLLEASEPPTFEVLTLSEAPLSALYTLNDHLISAQGSDTPFSTPLTSLTSPARPLHDLNGPLEGELISAASVRTAEGRTELVLTTEGLYAVRPPEARRSPLEALIPSPIITLAALEDELWLATTHALYQWREGALREVQIEGVRFNTAPRLALGADFRGVRALWVACGPEEGSAEGGAEGSAGEGQLFVIERDHPELRVWRVSSSLGLSHLGSDARGALWGASEGLLYRRSPSGVWSRHLLPELSQDTPEGVLWVSARPERAVVWVASEGGVWAAVSVGEDLTLWPVSDERWSHPTGVAQLLDPTQEVAVLWGAQGATLLTLPQEALPEPPPPPTWLNDVQPLSTARCGVCHATGGVGHHLERYEQWVEEFDLLFSNVTRAQMPLGAPPLTRSELEVLRAWREGGFLVGEE